jgi:hypothetical protein
VKRFSGTVVVLGSGPSLTIEDVESTKHLPTISVNTSWEKARHCQVIFAGDHRWWCDNAEKIDISAHRVTLSSNSERQYNAERFKSKVGISAGYNSGAVAIEYAIRGGADRVILLGMDCSVKLGEHHHGKHPKSPNPTEQKCRIWKGQFKAVRERYAGADVVNCSRYTELDMFPTMSLEEALCGHSLTSDTQYQSEGESIAMA